MRTLSRPPFASVALFALLSAAIPLQASAAEPAPRGVLIDFTATWCGPCQEMSPIIKRLYREGYPVRKVDIDAHPELAKQFNITGIPAFVLVVDGREVARVVGRTSESQLRQLLARIPDGDPVAAGTRLASAEPARPVALPLGSRGGAGNIARASAPSAARSQGATVPVRSVPATFATDDAPAREFASAEFETPVVRANLDPEEAIDRADPSSRVIGNPLAASVRLRVQDRRGVNFGSGTIVDSRPGRTVVLSCGHIFRDLDPSATIEVDIFDGDRVETFLGKVLQYDLEGDVGIVTIPTDGWLPVCAVAIPAQKVAEADQLLSIGCGRGEPPSEMRVQVTRINRYIGPENIECTGVPVQGRSGGGLFDPAGRVVGVCIAADNRDRRGLYAGLDPIHDLLDRCGLTYLYRPADSAIASSGHGKTPAAARTASAPGERCPESRIAREEAPVARELLAAATQPTTISREAVAASIDPYQSPARSAQPEESPAAANDREAAIAEALEYAGDAEVICIIRPHDDPQSSSRVVIINRASPKFVAYLTGELEEQPQTVAHRAPADEPAAAGRRFETGRAFDDGRVLDQARAFDDRLEHSAGPDNPRGRSFAQEFPGEEDFSMAGYGSAATGEEARQPYRRSR